MTVWLVKETSISQGCCIYDILDIVGIADQEATARVVAKEFMSRFPTKEYEEIERGYWVERSGGFSVFYTEIQVRTS